MNLRYIRPMSSFRYARYLDALQRSEEEYAALKDQIKATKEARKKVSYSVASICIKMIVSAYRSIGGIAGVR